MPKQIVDGEYFYMTPWACGWVRVSGGRISTASPGLEKMKGWPATAMAKYKYKLLSDSPFTPAKPLPKPASDLLTAPVDTNPRPRWSSDPINAFIMRHNVKVRCLSGDPIARAIAKEIAVDKYIKEHMMPASDLVDGEIVLVGDRTEFLSK